MPITKRRRELRRNYIGASDIASVLNCNPFQSRRDLYEIKVNELEEEKVREGDPRDIGNLMENGILDYAARHLGKLRRNQFYSFPDAFIGASCDAIVAEPLYKWVLKGAPVEAKTSGVYYPTHEFEYWGDDRTELVPDYITTQVYGQMIAIGIEVGYVSAFIGGKGLRLYIIPRRQELADFIVEECRDFWLNHVQARIRPDDTVPSFNILKRIRRIAQKTTEIPWEVVETWMNSRDARLTAEKIEAQAKAEMIDQLGDAEAGIVLGKGMVSFFETRMNRLDEKRFKDERPALAAEYTREIRFRTPRWKKEKALKRVNKLK